MFTENVYDLCNNNLKAIVSKAHFLFYFVIILSPLLPGLRMFFIQQPLLSHFHCRYANSFRDQQTRRAYFQKKNF